jgi:hypothetical protein
VLIRQRHVRKSLADGWSDVGKINGGIHTCSLSITHYQ